MKSTSYLVIYDGECSVCRAWIRRLAWLDRCQKTQAIPFQRQDDLSTLHPQLNKEAALLEIQVVTPDGKLLGGWEGVCCIARLFPMTWPIGFLGVLPPFYWLGIFAYRQYATKRHCKI